MTRRARSWQGAGGQCRLFGQQRPPARWHCHYLQPQRWSTQHSPLATMLATTSPVLAPFVVGATTFSCFQGSASTRNPITSSRASWQVECASLLAPPHSIDHRANRLT